MRQERFPPVEETGGLFDASACVEQLVALIADVQSHAEILAGFQEGGDLLPEVVDVDDQFGEPGFFQFQDDAFQHRHAAYGDQGFRHVVGEGFQAGA